MQVDLAPDVFNDADALADLVGLMKCFSTGRHDWLASPVAEEAAKRYFAEHTPSLAGTFATLGRKGFEAAAWIPKQRQAAVITIRPADLATATADLLRPAVLVVENQDGDGGFVRAVARAFCAERVLVALREGWLDIDHGGGEDLTAVCKQASSRFQIHTRVAAVLDSDRLSPGQRTRAHDKADELRAAGVVVHVLEFREAENYVPNRVLAAIGKPSVASAKLNLLKQMTPQQRGHFDMKKGFWPADRESEIAAEHRELFVGLDPAVVVGLQGGFGPRILKKLAEMTDAVREHDFMQLGDDLAEELRQMLATISRVI